MKPATREEWLSEVMKMKKQDIAALAHDLLTKKLELDAENAQLRDIAAASIWRIDQIRRGLAALEERHEIK